MFEIKELSFPTSECNQSSGNWVIVQYPNFYKKWSVIGQSAIHTHTTFNEVCFHELVL